MINLAKMMIDSPSEPGNIKNVKYFSDLQILAAFHRKFPCQIQHRKTGCAKNRFSLELILNGEVDLLLDDTRIRLTGPCLFWIGDRHKFFQYELIPGSGYEHWWIDFTGERGRRIYESLSEAYPDSHIPLKNVKTILPVFEGFARKFKNPRRPDSSAEDVFLIEQLMREIIRQTQHEHQPDVNDPHGLRALAEQIDNAPFEKYEPHQLAKDAGLSYVHFRTLFKQLHGESLWQYILKQRMLTAGELLKGGQFRVGELSDYCGFPDQGSFTRAFKRFYHMSPLQWMKKSEEN